MLNKSDCVSCRGTLIEDDNIVLCAECDAFPKSVCLLKTWSVVLNGHKLPTTYLAVSRKRNALAVGLPGGKVDKGETLRQALAREVREETGLTIITAKPVFAGVCEGEVDYLNVTFTATTSGKLYTSEPINIRWVLENDLFQGPFRKYNGRLLRALQG